MVGHGCCELTVRKTHCADRGFGHIEIQEVWEMLRLPAFSATAEAAPLLANLVLVGTAKYYYCYHCYDDDDYYYHYHYYHYYHHYYYYYYC